MIKSPGVNLATKAPKNGDGPKMVNVRRRQDRATQTREKILEAAAIEFAVSGFDGVTTRSIAIRADIPHGLVIYHFQTKLGVWQAVVTDALIYFHERHMQHVEKFAGHDDVTLLREVLSVSIYTFADRPELTWVLSLEGHESELMAELVEEFIGSDIQFTLDLIQRVQKLGRYAEGNPVHLHHLFVGASSHVFSLPKIVERTIGHSPFERDFVRMHAELCLSVFFRDPKP